MGHVRHPRDIWHAGQGAQLRGRCPHLERLMEEERDEQRARGVEVLVVQAQRHADNEAAGRKRSDSCFTATGCSRLS
jgi:hypothetical protein